MNWKGHEKQLLWNALSTIPAIRMVSVPNEIQTGYFQGPKKKRYCCGQIGQTRYTQKHTHTHIRIKYGM
jgi:hypothetical protein